MKISHAMTTSKILTDFCAIRQKKNKNVYNYCLQCFSTEKVL